MIVTESVIGTVIESVIATETANEIVTVIVTETGKGTEIGIGTVIVIVIANETETEIGIGTVDSAALVALRSPRVETVPQSFVPSTPLLCLHGSHHALTDHVHIDLPLVVRVIAIALVVGAVVAAAEEEAAAVVGIRGTIVAAIAGSSAYLRSSRIWR